MVMIMTSKNQTLRAKKEIKYNIIKNNFQNQNMQQKLWTEPRSLALACCAFQTPT